MADKSQTTIVKLNNCKYQTWKFKVELLLMKEDLWEIITEDTPTPVTTEWKNKDGKTRATIGLLVGRQSITSHTKKQNSKRNMAGFEIIP